MPTMPPTYRPPGMRSARQRNREADLRRKEARPDHGWYNLAVWRGPNGRRAQQQAKQPYCERCLSRGVVVLMNVANHNPPHNGDWDQFIGGPLESLCYHCHNSEAQSEERAAKASARRAKR